MADDSPAEPYSSELELLALSELVSQPVVLQLKSLLAQKNPAVLNAFETFSWSRNEKALLSQVSSLVLNISEDPKTGKSMRRPPSITVPYNREYSYYSTMDSQFSGKDSDSGSLALIRRQKVLVMGIEERVEEAEDFDCSFDSMESNDEENRVSINRKMQFLKSLKINGAVFEKEETSHKLSSEEEGLEQQPEGPQDCL